MPVAVVVVQTIVQGTVAVTLGADDGDPQLCAIILNEVVAVMIEWPSSRSLRPGVMVIGLMRVLGLLAPEKTS